MNGLKVPKDEANKIRLVLLDRKLLSLNWKIKRSAGFVYLPLEEIPSRELLNGLGLQKDDLIDTEFIEIQTLPRSMEDHLKGIMPLEKLEELKKSFDIMGDVVILEIPAELDSEKYLIGKAALKFTKRKSVYRKKSEIKGVTRTRELEHLAGEDFPETIHREFGTQLMLNVKKVYFSPRLATERRIVALEVQDGELILDMFCGVGPYSINIARHKKVKICAVDINPEAIHYLKKNIKINKLKGRIKPCLGDVKDVLAALEENFDRIIMNLPETAKDYLPLALKHLKDGGIINYYEFSPDYAGAVTSIKEAAYPSKVELLHKRKVKSRSPGIWQVAIDAQIKKN